MQIKENTSSHPGKISLGVGRYATQLTCQKYFDEPTSHSVKRKLQLVIKTAHTKIKETTSVWHTRKVARIGCACPGPATSKRKSRTLEHSPRACTHVRTEIAYKQHFFWRGQDRFASQFSANHIQFRIAKLRFCIANCDAIPDINSSLLCIDLRDEVASAGR